MISTVPKDPTWRCAMGIIIQCRHVWGFADFDGLLLIHSKQAVFLAGPRGHHIFSDHAIKLFYYELRSPVSLMNALA